MSSQLCHYEELHNLYSSPNIGWVGHITRIKVTRNAYKILIGKCEGRDNSEDLVAGRKIVINVMDTQPREGNLWTGAT
jgi:hypothetical protein